MFPLETEGSGLGTDPSLAVAQGGETNRHAPRAMPLSADIDCRETPSWEQLATLLVGLARHTAFSLPFLAMFVCKKPLNNPRLRNPSGFLFWL